MVLLTISKIQENQERTYGFHSKCKFLSLPIVLLLLVIIVHPHKWQILLPCSNMTVAIERDIKHKL